MKFTILECVTRLNQILNYPSLTYGDVSHFFDQAISEINSELHIGLRPISEIYKNSSFRFEDLEHFIMLENAPLPNIPTDETAPVYIKDGVIYYTKNDKTVSTSKLYALVSKFEDGAIVNQMWHTVLVNTSAYWTPYTVITDDNVDLLEYLPFDWIVLFLIPYVCFKYAIRDGDSGASYAEDFSNGFQQLRNSYDIPHNVILSQQAGKIAYKQDVEKYLPNLNTLVPTRAIYEDMKIPRNIQAQYGSVYDRGGWGF